MEERKGILEESRVGPPLQHAPEHRRTPELHATTSVSADRDASRTPPKPSDSAKRLPFSVDSILAKTSHKSASRHARRSDSDVSSDSRVEQHRQSPRAEAEQRFQSDFRGAAAAHQANFFRMYARDTHAMELAMRGTPAADTRPDPRTCSSRRATMSSSLNTEPQSPTSSAHSLTDTSDHDAVDDDDALINIETDCDDVTHAPDDVSDDDDAVKKPAAEPARGAGSHGKENSLQTYHLNVSSLLEKERFAGQLGQRLLPPGWNPHLPLPWMGNMSAFSKPMPGKHSTHIKNITSNSVHVFQQDFLTALHETKLN